MTPSLGRPVVPARHSKRQERRVAREFGGRRVPGSGNQPNYRGDVRFGDFLGELKLVLRGSSYRLTLKTLRKIEREAAAIGKRPFLGIEFRSEGSIESPGPMYVVFPIDLARGLLRK